MFGQLHLLSTPSIEPILCNVFLISVIPRTALSVLNSINLYTSSIDLHHSRLTLNLRPPGSDIRNPIEVEKVLQESPQDQETNMARTKKKAAEKQETSKSSWPSIRSFFPTVTPARWQIQTNQTAVDSAMPPPHLPSDEFDASQDFLSHLGDVDMADVMPDRATKPDPDAHDESIVDLSVCNTDEFSTPPTTPRPDYPRDSDTSTEPRADYPDLEMADALYVQKPDSVRLPPPGQHNRKRSLPETTFPPLARKVSRDSEAHRSPRLYKVNTLLPVRSETTHSFDSSTSAALSFTSTSTNSTTPGTSFSPETSFTSIQSSATSFGEPSVPFAGVLFRQDERPLLRQYERNYESANRMDIEKNYPESKTNVPSPIPPTRECLPPNTSSTDQYLANLVSTGPFGNHVHALFSNLQSLIISGSFDHSLCSTTPFREAYETIRAANHCKVPVNEAAKGSARNVEDYDLFWTSLCSNIRKVGKVPPESSSKDAWKKAGDSFDGVVLTGDLTYLEQRGSSVFDFRLKPLKIERSYRLSRRFGSDRFFILGMPGLAAENLPSYLKSEAASIRRGIIHWLVNSEHRFLGRVWRAFYVKPPPTNRVRKNDQGSFNEIKHRVYFFAVDGHDFSPRINPSSPKRHEAMTVKDLLEWFMPTAVNLEQPCLKFFARLALGLRTLASCTKWC